MNNKNNHHIESLSSKLAIQLLKDQGMESILNIQNFAKALDDNFMQYYQDNFYDLVSKYEPNVKTRELKRKSEVCAKICLSKAFLYYYNIRVDLALKTIEAFIHCPHLNNKNFNIVPSWYLSKRVGLSQQKINAIFMLLDLLNMAEIKRDANNNLYVKCMPIILDDIWLREKKKDFKASNEKAYAKARYERESLYHFGISNEAYNQNIRRRIIETTLAINHLFDLNLTLRNEYYINGNRLDIIYNECPVDLIAFELKISEAKVREELNKLCNKTDFISKHDKVYIDTQGISHYTNSEYKWFNKEDITNNMKLEEGHPPVTENSIIWHTENLEKSKYYKKYKKNMNKILERTKSALILYTLKDKIYKEVKEEILTETEQKIKDEEDKKAYEDSINKLSKEDIEKCGDFVFSGCASIVTIDKLKQIEQEKFKPTIYSKDYIDNMSIPKLINGLKRTMYSLVNCKRNALNYLIRQKNYITELIKSKIYTYSKNTNYDQAVKWKQEVEYLTSNQNPNESILYEYIEVPLYISVKDKFIADLTSKMV